MGRAWRESPSSRVTAETVPSRAMTVSRKKVSSPPPRFHGHSEHPAAARSRQPHVRRREERVRLRARVSAPHVADSADEAEGRALAAAVEETSLRSAPSPARTSAGTRLGRISGRAAQEAAEHREPGPALLRLDAVEHPRGPGTRAAPCAAGHRRGPWPSEASATARSTQRTRARCRATRPDSSAVRSDST